MNLSSKTPPAVRMMTTEDFLSLAERIGRIYRAPGSGAGEGYLRAKREIKLQLDQAGMTPEEFDRTMKPIAKRRRVIKLSRMQFE
jgi:hypothetical protein